MKKCFKCGEVKDLSQFYKNKMMKDGHLNKCKSCARVDVQENRKKRIEYYREYDRKRGNRQTKDYLDEYREKFPNKYKAHTMVNNAIRSGLLFREKCSECGSDQKTHAHHDDYLKPLNIRWLCPACHKEWHQKNGEGANAT